LRKSLDLGTALQSRELFALFRHRVRTKVPSVGQFALGNLKLKIGFPSQEMVFRKRKATGLGTMNLKSTVGQEEAILSFRTSYSQHERVISTGSSSKHPLSRPNFLYVFNFKSC
jgi:hypothetical protein